MRSDRRRSAADRSRRCRQPRGPRRARGVPRPASADVLDRPSTRKGTVVYADVAEADEKVGALALLADLAREYAAEKQRLGVLDFSDQVAGALEVVRAHAVVADEVRERFRVVLLDEYQDTSVVQTDLLAALFADTAVMAVGDPHQAIYGWRGASAGNLGGFADAFSPGSRMRAVLADDQLAQQRTGA